MKKAIAIVLVMVLVLSFASCKLPLPDQVRSQSSQIVTNSSSPKDVSVQFLNTFLQNIYGSPDAWLELTNASPERYKEVSEQYTDLMDSTFASIGFAVDKDLINQLLNAMVSRIEIAASDEKIEGENAVVTLTVTYPDMSSMENKMLAEIQGNPSKYAELIAKIQASAQDDAEQDFNAYIEALMPLIVELIQSADTNETDVEISLIKKDGKWLVDIEKNDDFLNFLMQ